PLFRMVRNRLRIDGMPSLGEALSKRAARLRWPSVLLVAVLSFPASAADPLPLPTGPIVLTISGKIEVTNSDLGAQFDRQMLDELGRIEVRTTTAWTDGIQLFEGTLLRDVLERVGASGTMITATAHNDYSVPIPVEDAMIYDVILATT